MRVLLSQAIGALVSMGLIAEKPQFFQLPKNYGCSDGAEIDLSEYVIDSMGNLYSKNSNTYVTKFGSRLVKLSNRTINDGYIVNSLRSFQNGGRGRKVTIRRVDLKKMVSNGSLTRVNENDFYVA